MARSNSMCVFFLLLCSQWLWKYNDDIIEVLCVCVCVCGSCVVSQCVCVCVCVCV
jgi:hypothetical protein